MFKKFKFQLGEPMPKRIHDEILECGYRKCCPRIEIFDDGSVVISDDDAESGSVGTIKIRPEATSRLAVMLEKFKKE